MPEPTDVDPESKSNPHPTSGSESNRRSDSESDQRPTSGSNSRSGSEPNQRPDSESNSHSGSELDPKVAGDPEAVADAEFALLLTHDVDRPYKSVQSVYHAVERREPTQLLDLAPGVNPWWQFEDVMELEDSLGVRSSFYFLREPHLLARDPSDWFDPFYWVEEFGRYDIETPKMLDVLDRLREGGWEVGLHGSYDAYDDPDRLGLEKGLLEDALGEEVVGCRQHHLNRGPNTWAHHRAIGLDYDASVGSSEEYGFEYGYRPLRPFGDEFVVFPLTLMESALPNPGEEFAEAWAVCEELLAEADREDAVMSVLWHPRLFTEADFPGYRRIYRRLVERALEMGAWVGPPRDYYEMLEHPAESADAPKLGDASSGADLADPDGSSGPGSGDGPNAPDEPGSVPAKILDKSRLRANRWGITK